MFRLVPTGGICRRNSDCHLSFWRPDPSLFELAKEGTAVRLFNITASHTKYVCIMDVMCTVKTATCVQWPYYRGGLFREIGIRSPDASQGQAWGAGLGGTLTSATS